MSYTVTGTAGNDTLNQAVDVGPGTIVGLAGNDEIRTGTGAVTVDGGSGEDTVVLQTGNTGTVTTGTENDSIFAAENAGSMVLFGNEGPIPSGSPAPRTRRPSWVETTRPTEAIV